MRWIFVVLDCLLIYCSGLVVFVVLDWLYPLWSGGDPSAQERARARRSAQEREGPGARRRKKRSRAQLAQPAQLARGADEALWARGASERALGAPLGP